LNANDRVLLLALPSDEDPIAMARTLTDGLIVGLAPTGQIYGARKLLADFENAMFAPADPDGGIPWRDDFFTVIYAPEHREATPEILRVLAPGGRAILAGTS
jgi:hypothetical protein